MSWIYNQDSENSQKLKVDRKFRNEPKNHRAISVRSERSKQIIAESLFYCAHARWFYLCCQWVRRMFSVFKYLKPQKLKFSLNNKCYILIIKFYPFYKLYF